MSDLSISVEMYLSTDQSLSSDDEALDVPLTSTQSAVLRSAVSSSLPSPHSIQVPGQYLRVPLLTAPHNQRYCGQSYLLVNIVDNKNQPSIDPNLENNVHAHQILLDCDSDFLSIVSFKVTPVAPQNVIYSGLDVTVDLELEILNSGPNVDVSNDGKPNIEIQAHISADTKYDPLLDSSVAFTFNLEETRQKFIEAFPSGSTRLIQGPVTAHIPLSACTSPYLLLSLHHGVTLTTKDHVLDNNLRYLGVSSLTKCSSQSVDFSVSSFGLPLGSRLNPSDQYPYHLTASIGIRGEMTVGSSVQPALTFQFYLSKDNVWDSGDLDLRFTGLEQAAALRTEFTSQANVGLNSQTEQLAIPGNISEELCGNIYLLVVLDPDAIVEEMSEYNNVYPWPVMVNCLYGQYSTICP